MLVADIFDKNRVWIAVMVRGFLLKTSSRIFSFSPIPQWPSNCQRSRRAHKRPRCPRGPTLVLKCRRQPVRIGRDPRGQQVN